MLHQDLLKLLFPLELGLVSEGDDAVAGKYLDDAHALAGAVLRNVFPHTAQECLADWERVLDLVPSAEDRLSPL